MTMFTAGSVLTASALNQLMPAGAILAYGGTGAPAGWLPCDGASCLRADYPELFAAIGTAFGAADGTHFNLPDLRGRFLRGVDGGSGRDPDKAGRTAMAPGGNGGDAVGSVQGDATRRPDSALTTDSQGSHDHKTWGSQSAATTFGVDNYGGSGHAAAGSANFAYTAADPRTSADGAHGHTVTGGGDNETRPLNAAVSFIIKT
jgi:microcystin-dependent protein